MTATNDVLLRSIQGLKDGQEWRNFLNAHGKGDYSVWMNADPFAVCDAMQISPCGRVSYVELKQRNHIFGQYPDCLIDEWKIRQLQKLAQDTGKRVFLAALYPRSGQIAIWEIREDDEYIVRDVMANAITVQAGASRKRPKRMVPLIIKDAKVYTHQFTKH